MKIYEFEKTSLPFKAKYYCYYEDIDVEYYFDMYNWYDKDDGGDIISLELITSIGDFIIKITNEMTEEDIIKEAERIIDGSVDDSE